MAHFVPLIFAIDPGTKQIGVAVLAGPDLLYYGVKTIAKRDTPQFVLTAVSRHIIQLIYRYEPQYLAIEKMFITQKNSALLAVVTEQIKALSKQKGLRVYEYAPTSVRKRLCETGRATKQTVAKFLAEQYPELKRYLNRRRQWERQYYANMFDAIAVGLVCYQDLMKKKDRLAAS